MKKMIVIVMIGVMLFCAGAQAESISNSFTKEQQAKWVTNSKFNGYFLQDIISHSSGMDYITIYVSGITAGLSYDPNFAVFITKNPKTRVMDFVSLMIIWYQKEPDKKFVPMADLLKSLINEVAEEK